MLAKRKYKSTLAINLWWELENAIQVHTNHFTKADKEDTLVDINNHDLIIALVERKSLSNFRKILTQNKQAEILLIVENKFTYCSHSILLFGLKLFQREKELDIACSFFQQDNLEKKSIKKYTAFPDIYSPELILTDWNLNLYRRYWSWRREMKGDRSLLSFISEYIMISWFKTTFGSPFSIYRIEVSYD